MQLSTGVSRERVEEFKRKTAVSEKRLVWQKVVNAAFWISLVAIVAIWYILYKNMLI